MRSVRCRSLILLRDDGCRGQISSKGQNEKLTHQRLAFYGGFAVCKPPFEPFYEKMLEAFKNEQIIPTADSYTTAENAYWSYNLTLSSLFDNEALKAITEDAEAEWVFTTIPREKCDEDDYVDEIIADWLNEDRILNKINASFIESRSIEWLAEFYSWISETANRMKRCRTLPIFISANGKAVSAYDREGNLILFLPTGEEVMGDDTSYSKWLVRFGSTNDESIERSGLFKEKTFDLRTLERIVTVTTIDRFPYDFFMPNGERHYIRRQHYDYIIFDESSMIPLVKIIYPLFCMKPCKFIIAGDPFQIEPVVHLDMWKGENIYTMVKLNSFSEPKTIPYDYDVKLLTTQYRSIPIIGDLFSRMTYDGVLEHDRTSEEQVYIDFGDQLDVKPLNIIKFPVSKYESIYRAKRLNSRTPYHIYSALFAYEFTSWISDVISRYNPKEKIRIGVIAAYKAQADMIDRLISSAKMPDTVSVQTGTIHGFQGDECEIIISVYNPPPSISLKKDMFLNKKNIINVSISRARDYLFILMPDDDTENVDNLLLIKKMESFIKESDDYTEYSSNYFEQLMFGNPNYLEENSFSTSHQSVNVYGLPEQKYEIRIEDNAIDIQIHKE